jgi:hypothetical protein
MPVNFLYCEGLSGSFDVAILKQICPKTCLLQPVGTKRILPQRTLGARDISPGSSVAAIKDRDFDDDDLTITNCPRNWEVTENFKKVQIGWYWERKEIENYLIDPIVVNRALGNQAPPNSEYQKALKAAAKKIADYTAARIALSRFRVRVLPLDNSWGQEREKGYYFPKDKGLKVENCRSKINSMVGDYQKNLREPEKGVLEIFDNFLEDCREGERFKHFLIFFSGKDLLWGMQKELRSFDFKSPIVFREKIKQNIEESNENVWEWLPEWQRLRELVSSSTF